MLTLIASWWMGCGATGPVVPDYVPFTCPSGAEMQQVAASDPPVPEPEDGWPPGEDLNAERWYCSGPGGREGSLVQVRKDGTVALRGSYAANRRDGPWEAAYPDGTPHWRGAFKAGKRAGTWTWWHENGMIAEEGAYLAGHRQGEWAAWYPSGNVREEGLYQTDQRTGLWASYKDDEDNSLASVESFEMGRSRGEVTASMGDMTWLVGCWRSQDQKVAECWTTKGGSIRGARVDDRPKAERFIEAMQINTVDGEAVYFTRPLTDAKQIDGRRWMSVSEDGVTELRLREADDNHLLFVSTTHGFPSRITYRRRGETLDVEMTGRRDGTSKSLRWTLIYDTTFDRLRGSMSETFEAVRKEMGKG